MAEFQLMVPRSSEKEDEDKAPVFSPMVPRAPGADSAPPVFEPMVESPDPSRALEGAIDTNPDQAAKNAAIAGRQGVPVDMVDADPELADREDRKATINNALIDAPGVSKALEDDPELFKMSHDDIPALTDLEKRMRALPRGLGPIEMAARLAAQDDEIDVGKEAADLGRSVAAGAVDVPAMGISGIADLNDVAARAMIRPFVFGFEKAGLDGVAQILRDQMPTGKGGYFLRPAGDQLKEYADAVAPDDPDFIDQVARGGGQLVGQITIALATGGLSSLASVATLGGMGADIQSDLVAESGSEGTVGGDLAIMGGAAVTALTEKLGLDILFNKMPAVVRSRFLRALAGMSSEGSQEVLEQVGQNITAFALHNPDIEIFPVDELAHEGAVGGAVGFIAGAIIPGRQAISAREALDEADKAAKALKLSERSPEKAAELRGKLLREQWGDNIAISADSVREFFQSNDDINPDDWLADLGVPLEQYQEALDRNGDIDVTPEGFARSIYGTDNYVSFRGHVRFGDAAMTSREAGDWLESGLKDEMDLAGAEIAQLSEPAQVEAAQIQAEVEDMLTAIGREPEVGVLLAARYATRAARSGGQVTALELWNRDKVQIVGPEGSTRPVVDDLQLTLDKMRSGVGPKFSATPALDMLRSDGVDPESTLAGELRAMGVTSRTHPGLYKTGGRGAADNFVQSESEIFRDDEPGADSYIPERSILDAIRDEVAGNPRRTIDEQTELDAFDVDTINMDEAMSVAGVNLDNTDAEIRAAIEGREFAQANFTNENEPIGDGRTFYGEAGDFMAAAGEVGAAALAVEAHDAARKFVQDAGATDGFEHLVFYGVGNSAALQTAGSTREVGFVAFPPSIMAIVEDAGHFLVAHHNHPGGTALSVADLSALSLPAMSSILAHSHDGAVSGARLTAEARGILGVEAVQYNQFKQILRIAHNRTRDVLQGAVNTEAVGADVARSEEHTSELQSPM